MTRAVFPKWRIICLIQAENEQERQKNEENRISFGEEKNEVEVWSVVEINWLLFHFVTYC